jgi:hypothetical protein
MLGPKRSVTSKLQAIDQLESAMGALGVYPNEILLQPARKIRAKTSSVNKRLEFSSSLQAWQFIA